MLRMRQTLGWGALGWCVLGLGIMACSGEASTPPTGSGGAGGGSTSSSSGSSSGSGAGGTGYCPDSPPADGTICPTPPGDNTLMSAHCSWGDDPRPECRTTARCDSGSWTVSTPNATVCAVEPLPATCDSAPPSAGTSCSDSTLACWYADGQRCWCSPCQGGSEYPSCQTIDPPEWACATPAAGCPSVIPQAGSPCSNAGLSCGPSCELEVICEDGYWQWRGGNCPICAAPDTPIATPEGERPMAELRVGDLVYSVNGDAIVAVPVARVGSTPVRGHTVMRVTLDSGAVLEISAGHPTGDGRTFGQLEGGQRLGAHHRVVRAEPVPYRHARTYDILPASDTGSYFAAGARIGTTLAAP